MFGGSDFKVALIPLFQLVPICFLGMSADQHSYLARNNMKRSSYPKSHPQSKIQRPANKGHHNNPEFINVVMQQVIKVFVPDLKMNISPISGSSRVLQVPR